MLKRIRPEVIFRSTSTLNVQVGNAYGKKMMPEKLYKPGQYFINAAVGYRGVVLFANSIYRRTKLEKGYSEKTISSKEVGLYGRPW